MTPTQKLRGRADVRAALVARLAEGCTLAAAAREFGVSYDTLRVLRRADPEFADACRAAMATSAPQQRVPQCFVTARQQAFLTALSETGCAVDAARASDVAVQTAYSQRRRDAGFAAAWAEARSDAADLVLGRLLKGAIAGFEKVEDSDGKVKRTVAQDPRAMLDVLGRLRGGTGTSVETRRMIEVTPERVAAARATILNALMQGSRLRTMEEAIVLPAPAAA